MRYRLFEIGSLPEGVTFHHNLQKVKSYIGYEYGTPTAWVIRDGKRYLAVSPKPKKKDFPIALDVPILQGLVVNLRLDAENRFAKPLNLRDDEISIATSFVGFALRSSLRDINTLWKGNSPYLHYTKTPLSLPERYAKRPVALYPGFSCGAVQLPTGELGLVIDVSHLYTDTRTLAQRMASGLDWRTLVARHFVYEFGPQWYFIQLKSVDRKTIEEAQFIDPRSKMTTNVYDYTMDKWRGRLTPALRELSVDDPAITYNYPSQSGERFAASALARLRYQTRDEEVGGLHSETIIAPDKRLQRIQKVITDHLAGKVLVDGMKLEIANEPLVAPRRVFAMPKQRFGNKKILYPPALEPERIKSYWNLRKKWLRDDSIGILSRDSGITNQFLLMPVSLTDDEEIAERIEEDLKAAVNHYSPTKYQPQVVVWDDNKAATIPEVRSVLLEQKKVMLRAGTACALVVLPPYMSRNRAAKLRRHIKRILSPEVRTKCILASEILKRLPSKGRDNHEKSGKYQSYLSYTALDLLVTSGYRLWALAEPLHYDLYIGIDVLTNTAGFTFVADGGAICRFVPSTSEQQEALSAEQVAHMITTQLRELIARIKEAYGRLPRHIIIHRDGRWHDSESMGLRHAVEQLFREGLLLAGVLVGVIEIQKTNAQHWRVFGRENSLVMNQSWGISHLRS